MSRLGLPSSFSFFFFYHTHSLPSHLPAPTLRKDKAHRLAVRTVKGPVPQPRLWHGSIHGGRVTLEGCDTASIFLGLPESFLRMPHASEVPEETRGRRRSCSRLVDIPVARPALQVSQLHGLATSHWRNGSGVLGRGARNGGRGPTKLAGW